MEILKIKVQSRMRILRKFREYRNKQGDDLR